MVLAVCRQVLGDEHDAQDASQATFLILAAPAGSIGRRESVASWLHGWRCVSRRRAPTRRIREGRVREQRGAEVMAATAVVQNEVRARRGPDASPWCTTSWPCLPESFRDPLVLCYLEGLTQEQAAATAPLPAGDNSEPAGAAGRS